MRIFHSYTSSQFAMKAALSLFFFVFWVPAAVRYETAVRKLHGAASAGAVRIHAHAAFGKCALYLFRLFVYKTVIV